MCHVFVQPVRIGVPRHVEPVTPPALAIGGRGQQPIDEPRQRLWPVVRQEGVDLGRVRRQTDQVERHAADERALVRRRGGRLPRRFELRQDEVIHWGLRPGAVPDGGDGRVDRRLKSPMNRLVGRQERA